MYQTITLILFILTSFQVVSEEKKDKRLVNDANKVLKSVKDHGVINPCKKNPVQKYKIVVVGSVMSKDFIEDAEKRYITKTTCDAYQLSKSDVAHTEMSDNDLEDVENLVISQLHELKGEQNAVIIIYLSSHGSVGCLETDSGKISHQKFINMIFRHIDNYGRDKITVKIYADYCHANSTKDYIIERTRHKSKDGKTKGKHSNGSGMSFDYKVDFFAASSSFKLAYDKGMYENITKSAEYCREYGECSQNPCIDDDPLFIKCICNFSKRRDLQFFSTYRHVDISKFSEKELKEMIDRGDFFIKTNAMKLLAKKIGYKIVPLLQRVAGNSELGQTVAIELLGDLKANSSSVMELLQRKVNDKRDFVKIAALESLKKIGKVRGSIDNKTILALAKLLEKNNSEEVSEAITKLVCMHASKVDNRTIWKSIQSKIIPIYTKKLHQKKGTNRSSTITSLGCLSSMISDDHKEKMIKKMSQLMDKKEDKTVMEAIVGTLSKFGKNSERASALLEKMLKGDNKKIVIDGIVKYGSKEGILMLLESPHKEIVETAIRKFSDLTYSMLAGKSLEGGFKGMEKKSPNLYPALERALRGTGSYTQKNALKILARLACYEKKAMSMLMDKLRKGTKQEKIRILNLLRANVIKHNESKAILKGLSRNKLRFEENSVKIKKRLTCNKIILENITSQIYQNDSEIQIAMIKVLSKFSIDVDQEKINTKVKDVEAYLNALRAIDTQTREKAYKLLQSLLQRKNSKVQIVALKALTTFGKKYQDDVLPLLNGLLRSKDKDFRSEATRILVKKKSKKAMKILMDNYSRLDKKVLRDALNSHGANISLIEDYLQSKNDNEKLIALNLLEVYKTQAATSIPKIKLLLKEKNIKVVSTALKTLQVVARKQKESYKLAVVDLARHQHKKIAQMALDLVSAEKLTFKKCPKSFIGQLKNNNYLIRKKAIDALLASCKDDSELIDILFKHLGDNSGDRNIVLDALKSIGYSNIPQEKIDKLIDIYSEAPRELKKKIIEILESMNLKKDKLLVTFLKNNPNASPKLNKKFLSSSEVIDKALDDFFEAESVEAKKAALKTLVLNSKGKENDIASELVSELEDSLDMDIDLQGDLMHAMASMAPDNQELMQAIKTIVSSDEASYRRKRLAIKALGKMGKKAQTKESLKQYLRSLIKKNKKKRSRLAKMVVKEAKKAIKNINQRSK